MGRKKQAEFAKWFSPVLDALRDLGDSGKPREVSAKVAENLNLSNETLDETLKSGGEPFSQSSCLGEAVSCLGGVARFVEVWNLEVD